MGFVADAAIRLRAVTEGFQNAMGAAESRLESFAGKAARVGAVMTAAGAAITGTLGFVTNSFVSLGDEMNDMSQRTGIGVEALTELRHAANLSGTSIEAVEGAVGRMQRGILQASQASAEQMRELANATDEERAAMEEGEGSAAGYALALQEIGLRVEDIQGLSPEEQFNRIAEALAAQEDATRRSALAQQLFGRSARELLPMLADGAEGLRSMRAEAHDLGIAMDQDAADSAAAMDDATVRLKASLRGLWMEIGSDLVPTLTTAAGWLKDQVVNLREWADAHPDLIRNIGLTVGAIGGFLMIAGPVVMAVGTISKFFSILSGSILLVTKVIPALWIAIASNPIAAIIILIVALVAALITWMGGWGKLWEYIKITGAALWQTIKDIINGVLSGTQAVIDAGALLLGGLKQLAGAIWVLVMDLWESFTGWLGDLFSAIGSWLGQVVSAVGEFISRIPAALASAWTAVVDWVGSAIDGVVDAVRGIGQAMYDAGRNILNSLWEGMKSLAGDIVDWFKGLLDSITPDALIDIQTNDETGTSLTPRARGGPVSALRSYLVGERGPEIFVPRASGTIIPNAGMQMIPAGGGLAPVTINVTTGPINSMLDVDAIADRLARRYRLRMNA